MMRILLLGALACLAVLVFVLLRNASARTAASLDVEFKLTDDQYQPLPGVPLRLVLGVADWQAPEAGRGKSAHSRTTEDRGQTTDGSAAGGLRKRR